MSMPVFSESLNSSDHIPPNLTEPFSQVLCVSDSDETVSDDAGNSHLSINTDSHAFVDLTSLSISPNELSSTMPGSEISQNTPCSLIEISDSANSTTLNCSTLNSNRSGMSSCARARLNDFFDNIPHSVQDVSLTKPKVGTLLSESIYDANLRENSDVDQTQPADMSEDNQFEEHWNVNISAKIKIKVRIPDVHSESSLNSDAEIKQTKQSKENPKPCSKAIHRLEPFIDDEMMTILTEIYGESWKTSKILALCQPSCRSKQILRPNENDCKDYNPLSKGIVLFMSSLDEKIPLNMCSVDALKYRTHFKNNKDQLMHRLYEIFNRYVFENKLEAPCVWNKKLTCTAGRCINSKTKTGRKSTIELSDKVVTCAERMRCTLVHEMCHAAAWIFSGQNGHGKEWKVWTNRAEKAFPELPSITVCHQYEIEYKYTYQCVLCAAKYKSHTRSKKTEDIRCAYCHGKIELFLNRKNKYGEIIATPAKKAKGFAAFIKETYKEVRRNEQSHAETMKILGKQFADLSMTQKSKYS